MRKSKEIDFDYATRKFRVFLEMDLCDGNPLMLEAKAELYLGILNGIGPIIDAEIAEFAERYGNETIKYAHHNSTEDEVDADSQPKTRFISNHVIQNNLHKKLLDGERKEEK